MKIQKAVYREGAAPQPSAFTSLKGLSTLRPTTINPGPTFRLLELPAELRNTIFEMVAKEETLCLFSHGGKLKSACSSPLLLANHQVHDEFQAYIHLCANIVARVKDFDFRHIVTFWNRLSDLELKTLPTNTSPSCRAVQVELQVLSSPIFNEALLWRWLNRIVHPTKKGSKTSISYKTVHSILMIRDPQRFRQPSKVTKSRVAHLHSWSSYIRWRMEDMEESRLKDEARKIHEALKEYASKQTISGYFW